jgi:hypothetical protein
MEILCHSLAVFAKYIIAKLLCSDFEKPNHLNIRKEYFMRQVNLAILFWLSMSAHLVQAQETVSQSERTEAFLASREQQQKNKSAKLGSAVDMPGINGLVKAISLKLPEPAFVDNPEQKRRLADAFLTDVALELAMLGFKPGDIRAASGNGTELVEAVAARVRGTASLRQQALLSDTLIIGKVTDVNEQDDKKDGYLSSVDVSVERSFSKGMKIGDVIELRRVSGLTASGRITSSVEDPLAVGDIILVVGSRAFYGGGKLTGQTKKTAVEMLPFYRVDKETLIPSSAYQQTASVSELPNQ